MTLDQNKRVKIICNNDTATKKGQVGYNPIYIFDYTWRCLIRNVNFLAKHAKIDICGDDKSWSTYSYGEAGDRLTGRITNKAGIMKGGQTVLIIDVHCVRPHTYRHIHKLHVKPPGWNV